MQAVTLRKMLAGPVLAGAIALLGAFVDTTGQAFPVLRTSTEHVQAGGGGNWPGGRLPGGGY